MGLRLREQAGSATVWVLLAALVLSAATVAALWGSGVMAAHRRAAAAADLAALAAAVKLPGAVAVVCAEARRVAALNDAELADCRVEADGTVVVFASVRVPLLPPVVVAARAGHAPIDSASSTSSSLTAPALSSGSLPFPHLGDCTHDGHPSAHPQSAMASRVACNQSRASA